MYKFPLNKKKGWVKKKVTKLCVTQQSTSSRINGTEQYDKGTRVSIATPTAVTIHNPAHVFVIMHILHAVLYTFPKVLTRRICLLIKSFSTW